MKDENTFENLLKKSKLTEKDAEEIGYKIKAEMAKRFLGYKDFEKQKKGRVWRTRDLVQFV